MPKIYKYLGIVFSFTVMNTNLYIFMVYTMAKKPKQRFIFLNGEINKIVLKDKGPGLEEKNVNNLKIIMQKILWKNG